MTRRRCNFSRSSVGDHIVDGRKPASEPRFALEDEALECPKTFIEKHFFRISSDGGQERKEKESKVVVLRQLFEEERQCLDKAAERRGLRTTSFGSRRQNWTLVIGHRTEAVCHEVEELCWKEAEQAIASKSFEKTNGPAQSQEEYERKQAEDKAAEEREVFLEEWRRQRKVNTITVKEEHDAFLNTTGETGPEYGIAGEWRVQGYAFERDLPESSHKFDFTLSFPGEEDGELFGAFDFGVLKGILRVDFEGLGSGSAVSGGLGGCTDGHVHNSEFEWRARDTEGYLQEGEGHLSMVVGSFTQMKGVLIATSLPSSASSVMAYEFNAFQVSSNPSPSLYLTWSEMRKRGTRFDYQSESPKCEDSDGGYETGSDDSPRSDQSRKSRHELEDDVKNLKMEVRKLVQEKASTIRSLECRLLGLYRKHARVYHEQKHLQLALSEQHDSLCEEQAAEIEQHDSLRKEQAAVIASLKLALSQHNDDLPTSGKKRKVNEQHVDNNRAACPEKEQSRPKGRRPG